MYDLRTQVGRDRFVADHWSDMALMAYRGYSALGRGAVVVLSDESGSPQLPIGYAPVEAHKNEELEYNVKEYDPEREIICVFELKNQEGTFGRYETEHPDQAPPVIFHSKSK